MLGRAAGGAAPGVLCCCYCCCCYCTVLLLPLPAQPPATLSNRTESLWRPPSALGSTSLPRGAGGPVRSCHIAAFRVCFCFLPAVLRYPLAARSRRPLSSARLAAAAAAAAAPRCTLEASAWPAGRGGSKTDNDLTVFLSPKHARPPHDGRVPVCLRQGTRPGPGSSVFPFRLVLPCSFFCLPFLLDFPFHLMLPCHDREAVLRKRWWGETDRAMAIVV